MSMKNSESYIKCAKFDAESNGTIFAVLILGQKFCGHNYLPKNPILTPFFDVWIIK